MTKNKDIVPWTCTDCGARFDTPKGGVCPGCDKVLCMKHMNEHLGERCSGVEPPDWFLAYEKVKGEKK